MSQSQLFSGDIELPPRPLINLEIEQLYGSFDYSLPVSPNLAILYGDNGTGKTTIIRALFHLLSPADGRGHRTEIAQTPFRRFSATFAGDVTIEAKRKDGILGPYTLRWLERGAVVMEVDVPTSGVDNVVPMGDLPLVEAFMSKVADLDTQIFIMTEDRTIQSDDLDDVPPRGAAFRRRVRYQYQMAESPVREDSLTPSQLRDLELLTSIERANEWLRRRAFQASNIGENNAHSIYAGIAERIAGLAAPGPDEGGTDIVSRLERVAKTTDQYSEYGLLSAFDADRFIRSIATANEGDRRTIEDLIRPYLDGIEARVKAMEEAFEVAKRLTTHLNEFFKFKHVSYDVRRGLQVSSDIDDRSLRLEQLSSGEKHLLLLFTYVVASRGRRSVLMIDEPELSLNVKWQRRLIEALLDLSAGSSVQFVLATHSIEMLSQYDDHVVSLDPQVAGWT